jgi:hypothetical protein
LHVILVTGSVKLRKNHIALPRTEALLSELFYVTQQTW